MEYYVELNSPVLGFSVQDNLIHCLCGRKLIKADKTTGKICFEKEIFLKEGQSRILVADQNHIAIRDFCTLHLFDTNNYEEIGVWQLGTDLSSDICGMTMDESKIICSIRNGKLITVNRTTYAQEEFAITNSSMWSLKPHENYLLCGTVDGKLLVLDKNSLAVLHKIDLGKQNIRSLEIDGEILYAAGQDKKLYKIDLNKFKVIGSRKNVHNKMFFCVGFCNENVVTISFPCGEIAMWTKDTMEKVWEMHVPLKLSGLTQIDGSEMMITSRNIFGIGRVLLY